MSTAEARTETVLERKAIAQRRALGVGAVSVPRVLGRSLSLAADALWSLALTADTGTETLQTAARALSAMTEDDLLIVLEREGGPVGLAVLDRALVTGLTEIQTLGKVTRFPLEERAFTATDASMVAPFLDAALSRFSSMLVGQPERAHLQGFRFGALVDGVQAAALSLEEERYSVLSLDLALAQGTRSGRAAFLFAAAPEKPAADPNSDAKPGKHEATMKLVPTRMLAVLTRIHIPLERAQALRPGDVLDLSPDVVNSATLVVDGGYVAAHGKIGQINGFRAVRIGSDRTILRSPSGAGGGHSTLSGASAPPAGNGLSATSDPSGGRAVHPPLAIQEEASPRGAASPAGMI